MQIEHCLIAFQWVKMVVVTVAVLWNEDPLPWRQKRRAVLEVQLLVLFLVRIYKYPFCPPSPLLFLSISFFGFTEEIEFSLCMTRAPHSIDLIISIPEKKTKLYWLLLFSRLFLFFFFGCYKARFHADIACANEWEDSHIIEKNWENELDFQKKACLKQLHITTFISSCIDLVAPPRATAPQEIRKTILILERQGVGADCPSRTDNEGNSSKAKVKKREKFRPVLASFQVQKSNRHPAE